MSESAGQRLQAARLARGLSLEDVTGHTKMRPSIIAALEADAFSTFPSITHARNFLSLYGKFLHVDIQDGLDRLAAPSRIGVENYQYLNVKRDAEPSFRTRPTLRRARSSPGLSGEQLPKMLAIVAVVLAFLFVGGYLAINLKRLNLSSKTDPESSSPSPLPVTPLPSPTPGSTPGAFPKTPGATPNQSPFFAPISDEHRLIPTPPRPPAQ